MEMIATGKAACAPVIKRFYGPTGFTAFQFFAVPGGMRIGGKPARLVIRKDTSNE
jgi:hypothetical protein